MRVAAIQFSRLLLLRRGGMELKLFQDMLSALPEDAKIVGFGEHATYSSLFLMVTSEKFKEVTLGSLPSEIIAKFETRRVGQDQFEDFFVEMDLSQALDKTRT